MSQRQRAFLEAEAIERMADAAKYEQEKTAEGQAKGMLLINQAMASNPEAAEFLLAKDRIAAFNEMAKNSDNDKVIVPYEATEFIGSLSILTSMLGKDKEGT